jgi:acylphosphatase
MISHYTITVSGQVQKVGFRFRANLEALRNNLHGFVRNEPDGSVHIEAEGEEEDLKHFLHWCQEGPAHAFVKNVEIRKNPVVGYTDFVIRH